MALFEKPIPPEPEDLARLSGAARAMERLQEALNGYRVGDTPHVIEITGLDEPSRELVNQILGEGEVSLLYEGPPRARIQESLLAGVWRTIFLDREGERARDLIEVCDIPLLARQRGEDPRSSIQERLYRDPPPDLMNAPAILAELRGHAENYRPGRPVRVINLTLLPMSAEDIAYLDDALGRGPLSILSRGYGDCRIDSTAIPAVWWVRYFNSMGRLILNTLEVVEVPLAACAAQEDLDESAVRLKEILEPYRL